MDTFDLTPYMYKIVSYSPTRIRVRLSCAEGYAHELAHRLRMRGIPCIPRSRGTIEVNRVGAVVRFLRLMELPPNMIAAVEEYGMLVEKKRVRPYERPYLEEAVRRIVAYSPLLDYRPRKQTIPTSERG